MFTIVDAYTDEPSGLGVPPYLGTYPRYVYGAINERFGEEANYLTIDDLRLLFMHDGKAPDKEKETVTNPWIYNLTRSSEETARIIRGTKELVVIAGIQTPGKYLIARPGTLHELKRLLARIKARKVLTGPAALAGTGLIGGKHAESLPLDFFSSVDADYLGINSYDNIREYAIKGAGIVRQIPYTIIAELETGRGCDIGKCSFCTEPLKSRLLFRDFHDVVREAGALKKAGVSHFRIGKQSCFYSYDGGNVHSIRSLLRGISALEPEVLHIDNVNPVKVVSSAGEEITKLIVSYCTPGNVAAFGVESFDSDVVRRNTLNSTPEISMRAIEAVNRFGAERGRNGMPLFLPGINFILGLIGETRRTLEINMKYLKDILGRGLLLRRINIRQVVPFPGTRLKAEAGTKFLRKNRRYYYSWRMRVRREIDYEMLKRIVPEGTILRDVRAEVYDGRRTFGRQLGTYPLTVGVNERLELGRFYDIRVIGHMLRSVTGEVVGEGSSQHEK